MGVGVRRGIGSLMYMLIAAQLIVLHTIDGREISINPAQVTSLHAAKPGEANKQLALGVRCLVNLTDGKFVSVAESCETVRRMLQ